MNDETLGQIEQQIAGIQPHGLPLELRGAVLGDVQRELRAARWDRRLARVATVMLIAGISLNFAISRGWGVGRGEATGRVAASRDREALTQAAEVIAEVTDRDTARRFAMRLAAMSGRELSREEATAIGAAVEGRAVHATLPGKKG